MLRSSSSMKPTKKTFFLSFSLQKLKKYNPKYTNKIFLHDQSQDILPNPFSWHQKVKRCKFTKEFVAPMYYNPRRFDRDPRACHLILYLVKNFRRCLKSPLLSLSRVPDYKFMLNLRTLRIVENSWAIWRATRFNNKLTGLVIVDIEQGDSNDKMSLPWKEKYLRRFLRSQRNLTNINLQVALKLEYYHYLTIIEDEIDYLKKLRAVNLDLRLQVSGLNISRQRIPKLFKFIQNLRVSEPPLYFLRLCSTGSELESFTNQWLDEPRALQNLSKLSVKMRNDLPTNWKLFHNLQGFGNLQEFNLSLHKPKVLTFKSIIDSIVLPETLLSFSFKLYYFDLTSVIKEGDWPVENPFSVTPFFANFFKCTERAKMLKRLKIHLSYTGFRSYHLGLVLSLCGGLTELNELEIKVQEIFPSMNSFLTEELQVDLLYKKLPHILQRLKKLVLMAPYLSFKNMMVVDKSMKLNNLEYFETTGNVLMEENQKGLNNLLRCMNPQRLLIRGENVESKEIIEGMFGLFDKMNKLTEVELEFQSSIVTKQTVMRLISEKLRRDIKASIIFGAPGDYSRDLFEIYLKMCCNKRNKPLLIIRGGLIQFNQENPALKNNAFYAI